jgi:ribosome maturation factor RimP
LECFDVEFGGGRLVVLVDRPGGVDLDALTHATHRISAALDREDPVPGRYLLEVSSPGLERRLRTADHYRRFVGSTVSVKLVPAAAEPRRIKGELSAADDDGIAVSGRSVPYADIERAQTVFEWGPPPKPGKARSKRARSSDRVPAATTDAPPTTSDQKAATQ